MRIMSSALLIAAFGFTATACAIDAESDDIEAELSAESLGQERPGLTLTAASPGDGKEPPITPSCGNVYRRDACGYEHQDCVCSNTHWAGYCALEFNACDWFLFCRCD